MPAVLSAASADDLDEADGLPRGADARVAFIVTTEPLAAGLRKKVGAAATIELIRPGVETTSDPLAARSQPSLCAAIAGAEALDADFEALLDAIKRVVRDAPQCQFFLAGHSDTHRLWQAARRADLLANLSLVPRRLGHGELLLRADVLIHPQANGRSRWLSLQAMARGQTLLARADPWLDYLVDDQTAWVVPATAAEPWERLLRRALDEPARAAALGERARLWVGPRYSYPRQTAQTLGLYRQLVGASIPFTATTRA
jgi:glycosyltransferase involved in cell wall biosynthesis